MPRSIDEEARHALQRLTTLLADAIRDQLPAQLGFALVLFTFEHGASAYASNANRTDMIRELRTIADRLEQE